MHPRVAPIAESHATSVRKIDERVSKKSVPTQAVVVSEAVAPRSSVTVNSISCRPTVANRRDVVSPSLVMSSVDHAHATIEPSGSNEPVPSAVTVIGAHPMSGLVVASATGALFIGRDTADAAFNRPPLTIRPSSDGMSSTESMIIFRISVGVAVGVRSRIMAAVPETIGAANEVPLHVPHPPMVVVRICEPGAARSTVFAP